MHTIIIETNNQKMETALINFLKAFNYNVVVKESKKSKSVNAKSKISELISIESITDTHEIPLSVIDSTANPESLFGIWKDRNLSLEKLRSVAWGGRA